MQHHTLRMSGHGQALREWQAFNDCKKTIDDFLEQLPLFQMLAHKAMRPRYTCRRRALVRTELRGMPPGELADGVSLPAGTGRRWCALRARS